MSFKDFNNISTVLEKFNIKYKEELFLKKGNFELSEYFIAELNFVKEHIDIRTSEYSICESIIYPLLKEVYKKHTAKLALWSHKAISFDKDLSGTPDYLFAKKSHLGRVVLDKPLVVLVEAKKNNFDEGWGQCLAEMVAAQKINDDPGISIYGIVTDGEVWKFGKLLQDDFIENKEFYTINKIEDISQVIEYILNSIEKEIVDNKV